MTSTEDDERSARLEWIANAKSRADIAAMKARGWEFWEILCSTQIEGPRAPGKDHLWAMLAVSYAPLPSDELGVWAPAPDEHGAPVMCPICGAPVLRRAHAPTTEDRIVEFGNALADAEQKAGHMFGGSQYAEDDEDLEVK